MGFHEDFKYFEMGFDTIHEEKLKEMMKYMNWPFEFLDKQFNYTITK